MQKKVKTDIKGGETSNKPGAMPRKRPSISACMMVKNEEHFLPQCLESIKDFVDEIVIVDTGSTDRTVEIAAEYGARIYHHPWENDFSKHRNQSISYAKGDWILIIDADEELDRPSGPLLRSSLETLDPDVISIFVRSYMEGGKYYNESTSPRLFKNHIGMKYSGIVHNQLGCEGRSVAFVKAVIWHYGYDLEEESKKKKQDRTLRLLWRQHEDMPDDGPTIHHLAASYFAKEDFQKAYELSYKVRKLLEADPAKCENRAYSWTYFILVASLGELERFEEAEKFCEEGLALFPDSVDLNFCMAFVSLRREKFEKALQYIEKYFLSREKLAKAPEKFGFVVFEKANKLWEAYKIKGATLLYLNRKHEAVPVFQKSVELAPESVKGIFCSSIGKMLNKKGFEDEAVSFWKQLPADAEFEEDLKMAGHLLMKQEKWDEAVRIFDSLKGGDSKEIFYYSGIALMELGHNEKAADCFSEAYRIAPNWEKNLVNWGMALERCGFNEAAVKKYEKAIEAGGDESLACQNLGYLYFREGKLVQAIPYLERGASIAPADVYMHLTLARCYLEAGEIELVVAVSEKILHLLNLPTDFLLESMPQVAQLFVGISGKLLEQGNPESFDMAFELAKSIGPDRSPDLKMLCRLAFEMGEYERGANILETALAVEPEDRELLGFLQDHIQKLERTGPDTLSDPEAARMPLNQLDL